MGVPSFAELHDRRVERRRIARIEHNALVGAARRAALRIGVFAVRNGRIPGVRIPQWGAAWLMRAAMMNPLADYEGSADALEDGLAFNAQTSKSFTGALVTTHTSGLRRDAVMAAVMGAVVDAATPSFDAAPTDGAAAAMANHADFIMVTMRVADESEAKISTDVAALSTAALKRGGSAPMTGALDLAGHAVTAVASLASHPAGAQSACTLERLERRLNNLVAAVRASAADLTALKVPALAAADPALVGPPPA